VEYTNDKIKNLIEERNKAIQNYDSEILKEIAKEKAKYKFSWKRFLFMIGAVVFMVLAVEINKKIFPKTSIWSWEYYQSEQKPCVGKK